MNIRRTAGADLTPLAMLLATAGMFGFGGACGGDGAAGGAGGDGGGGGEGGVLGDGAVDETPSCKAGGASGGVAPAAPSLLRNLHTGETCWFSSPAVADLDGDGKNEIVAPCYSTFVFDAGGKQIAKGTATKGRVYAPAVVADLDGDGKKEIVVGGNEGSVVAYAFAAGASSLATKAGWASVSTCSAGSCPEARGMAAGDLDGDGKIEVVVTTTQTEPAGAQVFVLEPDGSTRPGWPRYDTTSDPTFNGVGNHGYGCYGENVGVGNVDDDPQLEILVTYDNHQINAFEPDGRSILASAWYSNPANEFLGQRMGWGQFIRWADPKVEDVHYHDHGAWPNVTDTMWLQWTASPPNVVDLDGDGRNEIVGLPNAELHEPYETQAYALMVLDGAHGDGSRAARRHAGFEALPLSDKPPVRAANDWYPPDGIPAPATVNVVGDARPEIVAPVNDGFVYAWGADGSRLWRYDYRKGRAKVFASEVAVVDLDQDGAPEIVFGTYGPDASGASLVVLANTGALRYEVALTGSQSDGNGVGIAAAPTVADVDGDGTLEILATTIDHGVDVFEVAGSGTQCLLWTTGRGGPLRAGRP